MTIVALSGIVLLAGAVGGVVHSIMPDSTLPAQRKGAVEIIRNIVLGAVAAWVSWGVYGPFASAAITGTSSTELTISALAGAFLIGVGGSRWLAKEVENKLQKKIISDQMKVDKAFKNTIDKYPQLRL